MSQYRVNSHEVTGSKIVSIQPLMAQGAMISPEAGLTLVLNSGSKHKWIAEKDGIAPSAGDFLVQDNELHTTFIVAAAKFQELFEEKIK